MFDTFRGLPMHAIVVHATVVLLPLMSLVTIATALVPRLRRWAWWVAVVDLGMVVLTFVTLQTGEALQARLGGQVAQRHAELARPLLPISLVMALTAVLVALAYRARLLATPDPGPSRGTVAAVGSSVLAVAAALVLVFWTVQVGEAGAQAVWGGVMASTTSK